TPTDPAHVLPARVYAALCRLVGGDPSSPWVAVPDRPAAIAAALVAVQVGGCHTPPLREGRGRRRAGPPPGGGIAAARGFPRGGWGGGSMGGGGGFTEGGYDPGPEPGSRSTPRMPRPGPRPYRRRERGTTSRTGPTREGSASTRRGASTPRPRPRSPHPGRPPT